MKEMIKRLRKEILARQILKIRKTGGKTVKSILRLLPPPQTYCVLRMGNPKRIAGH